MKLNTAYVILIFVLFGIILFQRACQKIPNPQPVITVVHDTQWTVIHDTITAKPKIEKQFIAGKEVHIIDTEWIDNTQKIDTSRIVRNYFAVNYYPYRYTTKYGDIIIRDSITQNKIRSRTIINTLKVPTITTTKTITLPGKPSLQLYVGGGLLGSKESPINGAGPLILIKTKGDQIYSGGAYFGSGTTQYHLETAWKIKVR